jgi:hypothetical protein
MNKKILVSILAVVILASVHVAEAQQAKKMPRIGYLGNGPRSSAVVEAFSTGAARPWLYRGPEHHD